MQKITVGLLLIFIVLSFVTMAIVYVVSYEEGYLQGVKDAVGRSWNIRDPTYKELIDFIELDTTDKQALAGAYIDEGHRCHYLTADLKNNAFVAGYRCAFISIVFNDNHTHAIAGFNTTDEGMIFIEPQNDRIVTLTIGEKYKFLQWLEHVTDYVIIW